MDFHVLLRSLREEKHLTQRAMAEELGVTIRAYQYYEAGKNYPSSMVLSRMAEIFQVPLESLLSAKDECLLSAQEKGTARDRARIARLVNEIGAMFAGGALEEEDKDAAMKALTDAYWEARKRNKELYTPEKYR